MNYRNCYPRFFGCLSLMMVGNDQALKDPSEVYLPSQAITDLMEYINDLIIAPDVSPGKGSQTGNSDSTQKSKQ